MIEPQEKPGDNPNPDAAPIPTQKQFEAMPPSTQRLPGGPAPGGQVSSGPHTTQVGPRSVVPVKWSDSANLLRQILDVFDREGQAAADAMRDWLNKTYPH